MSRGEQGTNAKVKSNSNRRKRGPGAVGETPCFDYIVDSLSAGRDVLRQEGAVMLPLLSLLCQQDLMVVPCRGTLFQLTMFRPGSTAASLHDGEPSIVRSLTARVPLPHHATSQRASQTWRWSLRGAVSMQVYKRCRRGISRWETFSRDHLSNRNTAEPPAVVIRSIVQSLIWRKGRRKKGPFTTTWQIREQTTSSNPEVITVDYTPGSI